MQLTKEQLEYKRQVREEENNEKLLLDLGQVKFSLGFNIDDGDPRALDELEVKSQILIQELLRRLEGE